MVFPISGLPISESPREFKSFGDAEALAKKLGLTDFLILLKAALLMAAQREMIGHADPERMLIASALQNPALRFLARFLPQSMSQALDIHKPVKEHPESLDAQLAYIAENWKVISPALRAKIYALLNYAASAKFSGFAEGYAPPPPAQSGPAHYSHDTAWMQGLVIVAKNVPLWLAQLSVEYGRSIKHLDEIPESELAFLQSCGVNGLWLVGLWRRSGASARIKKNSGSAEAESSAYSVFSYTIDGAYGGDAAFQIFRDRARQNKVSLGCDMVPNHTGIDSLWLREHPDWFMQTGVKPFPSYSFSGENLSETAGSQTQIEEHYYDHSDAAVVFRHEENGHTRFIYHGNDGTGLPWNDTAQLNHLIPEVREALINAALALAQKFDFIRFDAAMTLLKEHYRRLWFPPENTTPAIASRAAFAMADADFDKQMPEFWRDLVDTFREKSPGTLLMAEAFWLTENYFIRAIGIHRVYNSAFMHFLHDEKNAEFSAFFAGHLQNGETLQRFVNYLSTPDEKPAAEMFANADKYFGAMKLIATLPGLPLIAPGQLEGFTEKYAMDQKIPRLAETKSHAMIERHRREITPLFQARSEFSDAKNLRWLSVTPHTAQQQVIAFETGATRRFHVLFNNSPMPISFSIEENHFSLAPYESRVNDAAMAAQRKSENRTLENPQSQLGNEITLDRYYAGVTIPVSALKSHASCAIGEFADIRLLVDWCVATEQKFIALLPVSDTGSNSSPYSALSAFALHPVYLRLDDIQGFETIATEVAEFRSASASGKIFLFDDILQFKQRMLRLIYDKAPEACLRSIPADFMTAPWLADYGVYKNIKSRLGEAPAYSWDAYPAKPEDIEALLLANTPATRRQFFETHRADTAFYIWLQYQCEIQLKAAAEYARSKGIFLKGDLPILLERDSVDVWLNPQLFRSDLKAGAPPDHYSADGQNWGFPVYDWPAHRSDGFSWWKSRIKRAENFFSAYRIDHVLGFFRIWCLDAEDTSGYCGFFLPSSPLSHDELRTILSEEKITALSTNENRERPLIKSGTEFYPAWNFNPKLAAAELSHEERAALLGLVDHRQKRDAEMQRQQGFEILSALKDSSSMLPCAEDLGAVPEYVGPTLSELKILALCVLRWRSQGDRLESPLHYKYLSVATPSVHDSSNLREWLADEGKHHYSGEDALHRVLAEIYASASALALVPIQDLLALDASLHGPAQKERINVPGTVSDKNWSYRMPLYLEDLLKRTDLTEKIRQFTSERNSRRFGG